MHSRLSLGETHDMGWTITRAGSALEVTEAEGRTAILTADGVEVDSQTTGYWEKVTLRHGDLEIVAQWGPRNTLTQVHVLDADGERTLLAPPPGSRAERRERLAREHPVRFTLQRVGIAAAEIVIGILGIGALISVFLRGLLPSINFSWLPNLSWPDWLHVSKPDWLRYLDPIYWLSKLGLSWPDIDLPSWLTDHTKYWVPLVIAVFVALAQLERRRKQDERREGDPPG